MSVCQTFLSGLYSLQSYPKKPTRLVFGNQPGKVGFILSKEFQDDLNALQIADRIVKPMEGKPFNVGLELSLEELQVQPISFVCC